MKRKNVSRRGSATVQAAPSNGDLGPEASESIQEGRLPESDHGAHLRLAAKTTIRDCAALKGSLEPLLRRPEPVIVVVEEVEHIDTAVLQLLFAFCRDRHSLGLATRWDGNSPAWQLAVGTLDPTRAGSSAEHLG